MFTESSQIKCPKSVFPIVIINRDGKNVLFQNKMKGVEKMEMVCADNVKEQTHPLTFEEMYLDNRKIMMYTAMKILNNFADSEDCVSEAFLRASKIFDRIHTLETKKLTSLLIIIVRNIALNKYKANQRVITVEEPDTETNSYCTDEYSFNSIITSINQLKDEFRDVLMVKYVYGYSVNEVANILGITVDTAYKRIQRAKKELSKLIENGEKA